MHYIKALVLAAVAVFLQLSPFPASAAPEPVDRDSRKPVVGNDSSTDIDHALIGATGMQEVIVHLKSPSVAKANCDSMDEQMAHTSELVVEQAGFMERTEILMPSAKQMACVHIVLNAVFLEVDAKDLEKLAADPDVVAIHQVVNYELDLSETVPYVGATAVQEDGFDGTGVKIAILDGGVDYTHADFGGPGTVDAYNAAYEDPTSRGPYFPTKKVVDGYDFVGELWPEGPLLPDDDPIDRSGHGTPVAAIAAGLNGVAPGASIFAVKVCSALKESSRCNGQALLQGMEFAVDPNGDGDTSDAVDVINLSIGQFYGKPFDDDLSQAVEAASALGVLSVAAAGNSGDKPYITGTPSAARSALSVAQTQVPSAMLDLITVGSEDYTAVFQPWSIPLNGNTVTGPLQYGDGQRGNLDGCLDFESGSLKGKIVLVDRGECNFTLKISKITLAGGLAGIIGLVAPGAPFTGGDGGDRPIGIPAYMVSQADSEAMKAAAANQADATIDPNNQLPLAMQMVGSSSRGPQNQATTLIKPEIGAPGSSVAAVVGTGDGRAPFGGTSGAAPMVTGAAALLLEAYPDLTPAEVKARLMNNAFTDIDTDPFKGLAPITRIGGGELRVDRALTAPAAAWDEDTLQGALSFGFIDVDKETRTLFKRIRLRNYSDEVRTYSIVPTFRYEDDAARGAVEVTPVFPGKVQLGSRQDRLISIKMTIRGDLLESNFMNSGSEGANGDVLTRNEYDGYLILDDGTHAIHMAWHVLPRKAASVVGDEVLDFTKNNAITIELENTGVGIAQIDSYSLLALSENLPEGGPGDQDPTPDIKAVGVKTILVGPDVCSDSPSFVWAFALNTWERQQHLINVRVAVFLDMDQDGEFDYAVVSADFSGVRIERGRLDGRQVSTVVNLETDEEMTFFFAEHAMNAGNTALFVCAEQLNMTFADLGETNVNVDYVLFDETFGGVSDFVEGLTITPGGERYTADFTEIGPQETGFLTVEDRGTTGGNTEELGIMLFTNGDRGPGARGGATQETESKLLLAV